MEMQNVFGNVRQLLLDSKFEGCIVWVQQDTPVPRFILKYNHPEFRFHYALLLSALVNPTLRVGLYFHAGQVLQAGQDPTLFLPTIETTTALWN